MSHKHDKEAKKATEKEKDESLTSKCSFIMNLYVGGSEATVALN